MNPFCVWGLFQGINNLLGFVFLNFEKITYRQHSVNSDWSLSLCKTAEAVRTSFLSLS